MTATTWTNTEVSMKPLQLFVGGDIASELHMSGTSRVSNV
ncbi:hypothetical protein MYOV002v2_p0112 [Vibrio phage 144E46.1]|nr:hypothetical protein MYOV002v2_p0112 [Vibrio phage 144E46.1]